jgi:hypothetical protein
MATVQLTEQLLNEQRIQDSKDDYWRKRNSMFVNHSDGSGGIDPMYSDELAQLDASYAAFFDMGVGFRDGTLKDASTNFNFDNAGQSDFMQKSETQFENISRENHCF